MRQTFSIEGTNIWFGNPISINNRKMENLISILILLSAFVIFSSCEKAADKATGDVTPGANCDEKVIISPTEFKDAPNDPFYISSMTIVDDCLKIKFSVSGCDGTSWVVGNDKVILHVSGKEILYKY